MFSELDDLLQLDISNHNVLAVTEQPPADAGFFMCHLINRALRASMMVRVFSLDKPASHYRHLCVKCSIDVRQAETNGSLGFVDGADLILRALRSGSGLLEANEPLPVRFVFEKLTSSVEWGVGQRGLLVLDDLSALLALGCPPSDILLLVQNLLTWCRKQDVMLAILMSGDTVDKGVQQLAAAVAGCADLAVTVRGLSSGHCAEVTGELELRRPGSTTLLRQFKAEDRNVRIFAAGMSRAVL